MTFGGTLMSLEMMDAHVQHFQPGFLDVAHSSRVPPPTLEQMHLLLGSPGVQDNLKPPTSRALLHV